MDGYVNKDIKEIKLHKIKFKKNELEDRLRFTFKNMEGHRNEMMPHHML